MKLTVKLAKSQLKINRRRTMWTLLGIVLSVAVITAISSFAASGISMFAEMFENDGWIMDDRFIFTILSLAGLLSAMVVTVSVVVVSNAFRVSAAERSVQFGILKSVGATKKQIRETVLYEGAILLLRGTPLGIALGSLIAALGMGIANRFLTPLNTLNEHLDVAFTLRFVLSWQAILASVLLAAFTVILSAWLPARRAAKIPAISAIRGHGEVKMEKARGGFFAGKLFGFSGTLAAKQIKRSRRNFRATVISIALSIVLFITASSLGTQLGRVTDMIWPDFDVPTFLSYHSPIHRTTHEDETHTRKFAPLPTALANQVAEELRAFENTPIIGFGVDFDTYRTTFPSEMLTQQFWDLMPAEFSLWAGSEDTQSFSVNFLTVDAHTHQNLAHRAGVGIDSNILINHAREIEWTEDGRINRWHEISPYYFAEQVLRIENAWVEGEYFYLPLHAELRAADLTPRLRNLFVSSGTNVTILVPELDALIYHWLADPVDIDGFMAHASEVRDALVPLVTTDDITPNVTVVDVQAEIYAVQNMGQMIMIFVYGFAALLILIGLTNVISTISTNIRTRAREFAALKSVGMDDRGLNRMLGFESLLCSLKALLFGLPVGILASFLMHGALADTARFDYEFPLVAFVACIFGVLFITWGVTRVSAQKLRGQNIVEALRAESGM